jgi:MFS family permease
MGVRRAAAFLLCLAVGMVLADSAVVTLALPEILRDLSTSVTGVAWVLITFNLVLALGAVPAALLCTRRAPGTVCAAGLVLFAAASAVCAAAGSLAVLLTARSVQAVGGALVVVSCLDLLVALSPQRGVARWTAAGVIGAATGPVAGGLLTSAFSWPSIFIVQVPLALVAVPAARSARTLPISTAARDRPHLAANAGLAALSAALTAALFLLVLLLVEGWRRSVTVVPIAALCARPLARIARAGRRSEIVAGTLLIAGGLIALALLPAAELGWTVAPQALVGLGLGLTVDSLTAAALHERVPRTVHGGWTIASRHAGVVIGLAILTPIFTHDLDAAQTPAKEAIAGLVLDARVSPQAKVSLAEGLARQLHAERGRVPDLHPAFVAQHGTGTLEAQLDDQLERAATRAFRRAFFVAAGLALLALLTLVPGRRR